MNWILFFLLDLYVWEWFLNFHYGRVGDSVWCSNLPSSNLSVPWELSCSDKQAYRKIRVWMIVCNQINLISDLLFWATMFRLRYFFTEPWFLFNVFFVRVMREKSLWVTRTRSQNVLFVCYNASQTIISYKP